MASSTAVFFIFLIGLIAASVIFNFWIWLLAAAGILIILLIVGLAIRHPSEAARSSRSVVPRTDAPTEKEMFQRDLRERIDEEWKKQDDDLGKWR